MKPPYKKSGVSLLMSFVLTFVVMMISVFVLTSVSRSLERTANIERSNQVFYAAEAGLEAAFFHANVRGPGVAFTSEAESQKITLEGVDSQVTWTLEGRANPVTGILREGENIEIPLYWDDATNPTDTIGFTGESTFTLSFSNASSTYGLSPTFTIGNNFFNANDVVIDWRLSTTGTSYVPDFPSVDNPCDSGNTYVCGDNISTNFDAVTNETVARTLPGMESGSVPSSFSDGDKPMLSFQSPQSFDKNGNKIPGIPYKLSGGTEFPTPFYTASAQVAYGDGFQKNVSVTLPHQRSVGAFNYVIFDN